MAEQSTSSCSSDSDEASGLNLSCSSSSFEEEEEISLEELEGHLGVLPYQYEPEAAAAAEPAEVGLGINGERRQDVPVNQWCTCQHCIVMETASECRCCREIPQTLAKMEQLKGDAVYCITEHPGFETVCLDVYVQEAAYYEYRQRYGHYGQDQDIHMRFRYIAYRQLVRWCWGYLGKENRVVLPACAVSKIRDRYPSAEYVGFQYPNIDLL